MKNVTIENPEQLEKALDALITRVGGTKERVTYQITPGIIYKGTQQYNCKEVHSEILIDARSNNKGRK